MSNYYNANRDAPNVIEGWLVAISSADRKKLDIRLYPCTVLGIHATKPPNRGSELPAIEGPVQQGLPLTRSAERITRLAVS